MIVKFIIFLLFFYFIYKLIINKANKHTLEKLNILFSELNKNEDTYENELKKLENNDENTIPKVIWIYWNSSYNQLNGLLKLCYYLITKFNQNYQIFFVNNDNLKIFVKDNAVLNIFNNKKLKSNFKSDLLRLYLLDTYGGIYIDFSIILTQSFDWIYEIEGINDKYEVVIYKSNKWSTNDQYPVVESWFIVSKKGNDFIKKSKERFIEILNKNNLRGELKKLLSDESIDYQRFRNLHGTYHLVYFLLINILQTYKYDNIKFLDCTTTNLTCSSLYGNQFTLLKIFNFPISDNEYNNILQHTKLIKLANYNRQFINFFDLYPPRKNSLIQRLIFS